MKTGRRGFFGLIAGLLASRWVPRPLRFPPRYYGGRIRLDEANSILKAKILPEIEGSYFRTDPLFAALKSEHPVSWEGAPIHGLTYEGTPIVADKYAPRANG